MIRIGRVSRLVLSAALVYWLSACSGEPQTGPGKVRWDRELCTRCAMSVSDRNYAAQIRGGPQGREPRLFKFDDIGCAVIWLDQQPWKNDPAVEIWVNDYRTGDWLDARKAWYVTGQTTPMDYALGATSDKTDGALDFAEARKHIYAVEERFQLHSGQPSSESQAAGAGETVQ